MYVVTLYPDSGLYWNETIGWTPNREQATVYRDADPGPDLCIGHRQLVTPA
jgi:hypothetical protein